MKNAATKIKKVFFNVKDKHSLIFNSTTTERIDRIAEDIQNIRKNNGYMQNILLYGPPRTGKTMISRAIAERAKIVSMYAEEFFSENELYKYFNSVRCKALALRISGFSGRNIYKLMNTINNRKYATKDGKLSHLLINQVVAEFTKQERSQHSHSILTKVKLAIKDMLSYLALLFAKPYFLLYGY
jgi:Cdc6-like AAA superfamily ATPase